MKKIDNYIGFSILLALIIAIGVISPSSAQKINSQSLDSTLFQQYEIIDIGGEGIATAIGDLNHDTRNDLVVTTWGQVKILYQNSDGTLSYPISYSGGSSPNSLDIGDLNNDSLNDLVVVDGYNNIGVFLQNADGTLNPSIKYASLSSPCAVKIGDVNNDKLNDVVVTHGYENYIGVFTQKNDGTLNPMVAYPAINNFWKSDIGIGDFNHDGLQDVVDLNSIYDYNPPITIFFQNQNGTLDEGINYYFGSFRSYSLAVGDVTRDGWDDIVLSLGGNRPDSWIYVFPQYETSFGDPSYQYMAYDIPEAVRLFDVTGDNRLDMLVLHGGWSALSIYEQNRNGLYTGAYTIFSLPYSSHYYEDGLAVGDINGDAAPDIAIADSNNGLVILKHSPMPPQYTFDDVPSTHWAWKYVEKLFKNGITGGCSQTPLNFCPDNLVTRAQMAIFLERGKRGSLYSPPPATGTIFGDIPVNHWAAAWIEILAADKITGGCGNGNFCPEQYITRDQMAVFLLRIKHGADYVPPSAGGSTGFYDVPNDYWAAAWIKQLAAEGITSGCGQGNFCPLSPVTRAQMAVFLTQTFDLP